MPIKSTKSEKKTIRKASKRDVPVELVITELVVPVVPDEPLAEKEELLEQPEEQSVEERVEELVGANACAEPLCSVPEEVEGQLVSSSDEEAQKPKKPRVLKEGKPLVNEAGEYLNPLTNRYVKVGTTLYKKLIKEGMICVIPV